MTVEAISDFVIQNKEVLFASFLVIAALTARQVKAIKERDGGRCRAPFEHTHRGRLNVHHIEPQHFTHGQGGDYGDYEENLLTLCEGAHQIIHPDLPETYEEYRKGNKNAFQEMGLRHSILGSRGEIDWNDEHDHKMHALARKNTVEARARGWVFPPPAKKRGDRA